MGSKRRGESLCGSFRRMDPTGVSSAESITARLDQCSEKCLVTLERIRVAHWIWTTSEKRPSSFWLSAVFEFLFALSSKGSSIQPLLRSIANITIVTVCLAGRCPGSGGSHNSTSKWISTTAERRRTISKWRIYPVLLSLFARMDGKFDFSPGGEMSQCV